MSKFNAGKIALRITHHAEHFNQVCRATIPEYWEAEVVDMSDELSRHLFNAVSSESQHLRIYGTSQRSKSEAIQDVADQLVRSNVTGTFKLVR